MCEAKLIDSDVETGDMRSSIYNIPYIFDLSRGGLIVPSKEVSDFVATGYAPLDLFDQHVSNKARNLSFVALEK